MSQTPDFSKINKTLRAINNVPDISRAFRVAALPTITLPDITQAFPVATVPTIALPDITQAFPVATVPTIALPDITQAFPVATVPTIALPDITQALGAINALPDITQALGGTNALSEMSEALRKALDTLGVDEVERLSRAAQGTALDYLQDLEEVEFENELVTYTFADVLTPQTQLAVAIFVWVYVFSIMATLAVRNFGISNELGTATGIGATWIADMAYKVTRILLRRIATDPDQG